MLAALRSPSCRVFSRVEIIAKDIIRKAAIGVWQLPPRSLVPIVAVFAYVFHVITVVNEVYRLRGEVDNLLPGIVCGRLALKP